MTTGATSKSQRGFNGGTALRDGPDVRARNFQMEFPGQTQDETRYSANVFVPEEIILFFYSL